MCAFSPFGNCLIASAQEMVHLTEDRSDTPHLKHQPLDDLVAGRQFRRHELSRLLGQIHEDGTGLEHGIRLTVGTVLIDDGRDLGVRIDGDEFGREPVVVFREPLDEPIERRHAGG